MHRMWKSYLSRWKKTRPRVPLRRPCPARARSSARNTTAFFHCDAQPHQAGWLFSRSLRITLQMARLLCCGVMRAPRLERFGQEIFKDHISGAHGTINPCQIAGFRLTLKNPVTRTGANYPACIVHCQLDDDGFGAATENIHCNGLRAQFVRDPESQPDGIVANRLGCPINAPAAPARPEITWDDKAAAGERPVADDNGRNLKFVVGKKLLCVEVAILQLRFAGRRVRIMTLGDFDCGAKMPQQHP